MAISARNQLKGEITEVILGNVMAHITIRVGQNLIDSVITRKSAEELKLKEGDTVTAVIKATEVMVVKEWMQTESCSDSTLFPGLRWSMRTAETFTHTNSRASRRVEAAHRDLSAARIHEPYSRQSLTWRRMTKCTLANGSYIRRDLLLGKVQILHRYKRVIHLVSIGSI